MTVGEARRILETDAFVAEKKLPSIARMEALGYFFLEFARVRLQRADLDASLARVVARVGHGATLDDACRDELGESLASLREAFYAHLAKTQGTKARLAGTRLGR